jgi:hypothetical protein
MVAALARMLADGRAVLVCIGLRSHILPQHSR